MLSFADVSKLVAAKWQFARKTQAKCITYKPLKPRVRLAISPSSIVT